MDFNDKRLIQELAEIRKQEITVCFVKANYQLLEDYTKQKNEFTKFRLKIDAGEEIDKKDLERLDEVSCASGSFKDFLHSKIKDLSNKQKFEEYVHYKQSGQLKSVAEIIIEEHVLANKSKILSSYLTDEQESIVLKEFNEKFKKSSSILNPISYFYAQYSHPDLEETVFDKDEYMSQEATKIKIINDYLEKHSKEIIEKYLAKNKDLILEQYRESLSQIDEHTVIIPEISNMIFGDELAGGIYLERADLRGCKFANIQFRGGSLRGANLRDTDLQGVIFDDCDLRDLDLRGADLHNTEINYTDHKDVKLVQGIKLSYSSPEKLREKNIFRKDNFIATRVEYVSEAVPLEDLVVLDPVYVRGLSEKVKKEFKVKKEDLIAYAKSEEALHGKSFVDFLEERYLDLTEEYYVSLKNEDFSNENIEFSGLDLSYVDFSGCNFDNLNMTDCCLENSCLERASMQGTNLENANMSNINATLIKLKNANLHGANLQGANLESAQLSDKTKRTKATTANFKFANMRNVEAEYINLDSCMADLANMQGMKASNANMYRIKLRGANLNKAILNHSKLIEADLTDATLRGAEAIEVDLRKAILENVQAIGIDLRRANLMEAQVQNANFSQALMEDLNAQEANFKRANLEKIFALKANFKQAILQEAQVKFANLQEAILEEIQGENISLKYSILKDVKAKHAKLLKASLQGVDAKGADLERAILEQANLSFADMRGAILKEANLRSADLRDGDFREIDLSGGQTQNIKINEDSRFENSIGGDEQIQSLRAQQETKTLYGKMKYALKNGFQSFEQSCKEAGKFLKNNIYASIIGVIIGVVIAIALTATAVPSGGASLILGMALLGAASASFINYKTSTTKVGKNLVDSIKHFTGQSDELKAKVKFNQRNKVREKVPELFSNDRGCIVVSPRDHIMMSSKSKKPADLKNIKPKQVLVNPIQVLR